MRVTTGQLRQILVNPAHYLAHARAPRDDRQWYGNPQRSWMEAAWRAYFAAGRNSDVLWTEFEARAGAGGMTASRARLARGAEPMLDLFLQWDEEQSSAPRLVFPPARDVPWRGHILALRRDLVYLTPTGYRILLLWTGHDLGLDQTHAGMMAAAILVHADHDLGTGRTERIDAWQLRSGKRRFWRRDDLAGDVMLLHDRLNDVELNLG